MTERKPPNFNVADLLPFADLVLGHARRLENLGTWREVLRRYYSAVEAGNAPHGHRNLLRVAQARRRLDDKNPDTIFFIIAWSAERAVEDIFESDADLNHVREKIHANDQSFNLSEFDQFDPANPKKPADGKLLSEESSRRHQEVEKIRGARVIRWLRRHGELDMADLYANDRAAFDRHREAGRCNIFGLLPETSAGVKEEVTGVTNVATEKE